MENSIKEKLKNFIDNIKNKEINTNDIVVGTLSNEVISYLSKKGIKIQSVDIVLEVGRYYHILNKVKKDTQIDVELFYDLDFYIENADIIIFDKLQKHLNLLFINQDKKNKRLFKIVVNPNYKINKYTFKNMILSAGYIEERNLKDKNYEVINNRGE